MASTFTFGSTSPLRIPFGSPLATTYIPFGRPSERVSFASQSSSSIHAGTQLSPGSAPNSVSVPSGQDYGATSSTIATPHLIRAPHVRTPTQIAAGQLDTSLMYSFMFLDTTSGSPDADADLFHVVQSITNHDTSVIGHHHSGGSLKILTQCPDFYRWIAVSTEPQEILQARVWKQLRDELLTNDFVQQLLSHSFTASIEATMSGAVRVVPAMINFQSRLADAVKSLDEIYNYN